MCVCVCARAYMYALACMLLTLPLLSVFLTEKIGDTDSDGDGDEDEDEDEDDDTQSPSTDCRAVLAGCRTLAVPVAPQSPVDQETDQTVIIIIIINLVYIAQFDTNGILIALYIVITYIQMQYVHV